MSPHLDAPVEGVPVEGARLIPAMDEAGPKLPKTEGAVRAQPPDQLASLLTGELTALLTDELRYEMERRLAELEALKRQALGSEPEARRYAQATLGLRAWAHAVHVAIHADPVAEGPGPE